MSSVFVRPPALDLHALRGFGAGPLSDKMGIQYHKLTAEHSLATMPAEGNTQSVGIVHGGAYVVLGEGLGSISANIHAGPERVAVGIEVNATHTGSASSGFITAECSAIHLGQNLTVHEIVCTDEQGRRLSTVRLTNYIKDRKK